MDDLGPEYRDCFGPDYDRGFNAAIRMPAHVRIAWLARAGELCAVLSFDFLKRYIDAAEAIAGVQPLVVGGVPGRN